MTFAEKIKYLRKEKGLSQAELATALNIGRSCLSMLEIGKNEPTASNLFLLAEFFGCSVDYLLGREDEASLVFTDKDRALGVVDNSPIALSKEERELIHLFDEAEEKLGKDYVRGVKQLVRITIDTKK